MILQSPSLFASIAFDFLVIGGGNAGLVVASRLSEEPDVVVGVIEAGDFTEDVNELEWPGMLGRVLGNPLYDWNFKSVPQMAANGRQLSLPRGKALGGSSAINFMNMGRASSGEYDALELLGNPGWNWKALLPYFMKTESIQPYMQDGVSRLNLHFTTGFHGSSGPIIKSFSNWFYDLYLDFFQSLATLNIPQNRDPDCGDNIGAITVALSVDSKTAKRSYAASAYYKPVADRKNLVLLLGTQATKIIFEKENRGILKATAVEFQGRDTPLYTAHAKVEVILSAGSFQTPQLLELSGIGSEDILSQHGIATIVALPGDHVWVPSRFTVDAESVTYDVVREEAGHLLHSELYLQQKGIYAGRHSVLAFCSVNTFLSPLEVENIRNRAHNETKPTTQKGLQKQWELQTKWLTDPLCAQLEIIHSPGWQLSPTKLPTPGSRYNTLITGLMHPFSRGSVHICSANPLLPPLIDPKYLDNPLDLDILVASLRFAKKIGQTEPMKSALLSQLDPTEEDFADESDERLREYVRNNCQSFHHPLGTASMLPREDGGVVNPELIVYGTSNLRVVDLSVIPIELSCHPQATVYAIAEKASDLIKNSQIRNRDYRVQA